MVWRLGVGVVEQRWSYFNLLLFATLQFSDLTAPFIQFGVGELFWMWGANSMFYLFTGDFVSRTMLVLDACIKYMLGLAYLQE